MLTHSAHTRGSWVSTSEREKKNEGIPEERDYPQQKGKGRGLREEGATAQDPGGQTKLTKLPSLLHLGEAHPSSCLPKPCPVHRSCKCPSGNLL